MKTIRENCSHDMQLLRDYFDKKRLEYKKLASEESRNEDWNYWKGKMAAFKEARDYVSRYDAKAPEKP